MLRCLDGCAAGLRPRTAPAAAREEQLGERQALQDPKLAAAAEVAEEVNEQRDEAADLELLERYSMLRAEGRFEEATSMFSKDARWVTLYKTSLEGSEEIGRWMNREKEKGRANLTEGQWHVDGDKYSRELTTKFPRGGLHEVIQSAVISRGCIKEVSITPKWQAHALVIDFALARERGDDQAALDKMAPNVVWKTWDNAEIAGKAAVSELMAEQRRHGERRDGTSDFEALGEVSDELGIFERAMDIQRSDGVRVCGTQTLTRAAMASGGGGGAPAPPAEAAAGPTGGAEPLRSVTVGSACSRAATAEAILGSILPNVGQAVLGRLRQEKVRTAEDLCGLDKGDLAQLGFKMVERSRVLRWARSFDPSAQARTPISASRWRGESGDPAQPPRDPAGQPCGGPRRQRGTRPQPRGGARQADASPRGGRRRREPGRVLVRPGGGARLEAGRRERLGGRPGRSRGPVRPER
ncbi:unnamed protein product [Prorocentrum cordatum]|uniref:Uncharacterized protein n=1 Tax=Prorocentrum cordatum TaxID=2364126 RepID=A0ABN9VP50_9DINO|nr:unnamed protein product [Polarella glacialis]